MKLKKNWQHIVLVVLFWGALIGPVTLYGYVFGFGLWDSNEDWARMGSAVGGGMPLYCRYLHLYYLGCSCTDKTK